MNPATASANTTQITTTPRFFIVRLASLA